MTRSEFVAFYKDIFEHSPWIVERAYDRGGEFLEAARAVLAEASDGEQLSLIRAHPELAASIELTAASSAEQTGAGLRALTAEEFETFSNLNAQYRQKFGFPFVICVREHTKASILENFASRLHNDAAAEQHTALAEIMKIAALRLQAR